MDKKRRTDRQIAYEYYSQVTIRKQYFCRISKTNYIPPGGVLWRRLTSILLWLIMYILWFFLICFWDVHIHPIAAVFRRLNEDHQHIFYDAEWWDENNFEKTRQTRRIWYHLVVVVVVGKNCHLFVYLVLMFWECEPQTYISTDTFC